MTKQKYAVKDLNEEHTAKALGSSLPISLKQSVEICSLLRNKKLQRAKTILSNVIAQKQVVPFKRYNRAIGHKKGKGISVGRYPAKASKEILVIVNSAETNAQVKGLNTGNLVIKHICAQKAGKRMHFGRQRGIRMKRTHIEVIVEEKAGEPKKEAKKIEEKKPIEKPKIEEKSQLKVESPKKVEEKSK